MGGVIVGGRGSKFEGGGQRWGVGVFYQKTGAFQKFFQVLIFYSFLVNSPLGKGDFENLHCYGHKKITLIFF